MATLKCRDEAKQKRNEAPTTKGKSAKRRRLHKPTKAQEPEPMDIDSIARDVVRSVQVSTQKSSSTSPLVISSVATASIVSDTSPPSAGRYVPKAPPTVDEVLDGLGRPKSAVKKKRRKKQIVVAPTPPPPTPSVATLQPQQPQQQQQQHQTKSTSTATPRLIPRRQVFLFRVLAFVWFAVMAKLTLGFIRPLPQAARMYPHIVPPHHVDGTEPPQKVLSNISLRDFLSQDEFHLALAPAFFGIYAYTGVLMAWKDTDYLENIQSVVGASAGAMAAVILAAGIEPHKVAELGRKMTLQSFADPALGFGIFKGDKFESIMEDFIQTSSPNRTMMMEDSTIPVACTVFDLKSMQGKILTSGSMARAARASSTFPLLFQPVVHGDEILIDGGIADMLGLNGLAAFSPDTPKRIVNVAVGGFLTTPPGPASMPEGVKAKEVLSVSILNTPQCGPWAMSNGPRAIEAARRAMEASLDLKLYHGEQEGHYELHVDARSFVE